MNRSTVTLLIVVALACYGVYIASRLPPMLTGPTLLLVLIGFVLQVVFALAAAVGVWTGASWATAAIVLLGVTTAVTWLIRGFVYGFVAYGPALVAAVLAIVVTWVLALYVGSRRVSQNA